ncbi:DNA cytosine methyltransferase [Neorhizobium sp. SOG26]|uniref:DNA cytosine methyltransferase n=1 Tax=Neorhizobium sp. SOG26 TaxID=2060726 RepID=UPI001FE116D3|nr:DNA cytosine methyltransferase [Neorhizobium sp. SOG26]
MSLGFQAAGCDITAAVEFDADAARSHGLNFHGGDPEHGKARDITNTKPADLTRDLGLGDPALAFDIIVGGPPCQAFARVGRSKLREVSDHPEAFRHDKRARLYIEYLDYVEACSPLMVVMENVPDMLNHGGHNIAAEVCEVMSSKGYTCTYTLLNAAFYGVPQMRERMFLVAVRKELLPERITLPEPTHWISLPPGYEGSRSVALKLLNRTFGSSADPYYQPAPQAKRGLPGAVSAEDALGDLPTIDARKMLELGTLKRGARRMSDAMPYPISSRPSRYAALMREWPGFEAKPHLVDHVIRYLPRDYPLFARLNPGDQYPEAYRHAVEMFHEAVEQKNAGGKPLMEGSEEWNALWKSIVPPYDASKFPNKWRKMEADKPARTLLAHLGKDSYTHIHYDSKQARTISVREAARLQSFPDGFRFSGTMNPAFRQIGNAVPPLLAKAVAEALLAQITAALDASTGPMCLTTRRN